MAKILWLADALRKGNLKVVEHSNWKNHIVSNDWQPIYGIAHATAAPRTQADNTQVSIVRNGRIGLSGPIANACVDRNGTWHVLSAGRCNTTLVGTAGPYAGLGNTNALGIEACNDNGLHSPPEAWPYAQYHSYARGWAVICNKLGWKSNRVRGHKEHTPRRKSDPLFSMTNFRALITHYQEESMATLDDDDRTWMLSNLKPPTVFDVWTKHVWPDHSTKPAINRTPADVLFRTRLDVGNTLGIAEATHNAVTSGVPVNVDAGAVALALSENTAFLDAIATAVANKVAQRMVD